MTLRSRFISRAVLAACAATMASAPVPAQTTRLSLADLQAQIQALRATMTCPPALPGEPRFQDKGNGTFCDAQTGLQWETKVTEPSSPSFVGHTSSWSVGFNLDRSGSLFTTWLPEINRDSAYKGSADPWPAEGCRAGRCDWRVPTVDELRSLVCSGPALPCSTGAPWPGQTAVGSYWTSTGARGGLGLSEIGLAYVMTYDGQTWQLQLAMKSSPLYMRAVRSTR